MAELSFGDLVITEIMRAPLAAPLSGEWFEVVNTTAADVNLDGLALRVDLFFGRVALDGERWLAPGERVVFGADADAVDVSYGPFRLPLVDLRGALYVEGPAGALLDSVAWGDGWAGLDGASLSLDPAHTSVGGNDVPEAWCDGAPLYDGTNRGTPGAPNDPC